MSRPNEVNLSTLRDSQPPRVVAQRIVDGALERALPEAPRMRRRGFGPLLVPAGLAFAAGLAAAFFVASPSPENPGSEPNLSSGAVAEVAAEPRTFAAAGHEVRVEPGSQVVAGRVTQGATELRVARGAAGFKVRHLKRDETFSVQVGALTVEAVGTQFAVEVEGPCARVEVNEGTVRVRRTGHEPEYLSQGNARTWCDHPNGPEVLSEEERLVLDALDLVRKGAPADLERASALLYGYDQRFSKGVYEEEALYYLARIAQRLGRAEEARAWAGRFLARFPQGRRADELRPLATSR